MLSQQEYGLMLPFDLRPGRECGSVLGHPPGLFVLFLTEMWERFSYYGMRALLIFYLTQHWLFDDHFSTLLYGTYTSLVYITPVLGGFLADRYLGQRKAVKFGAVLLVIGHCLMAIDGGGQQDSLSLNLFWMALAFIIVGTGFLKGNISVLVGELYEKADIRRDGGYTLFYVGINIGATIGSLTAGYLGQTYGWGYGFGAAGIGMLLGLVVFTAGRPALAGKGETPDPNILARRICGVRLEQFIYLLAATSTGIIWLLLKFPDVVGYLLVLSGLLVLSYILYHAATRLDRGERRRIYAILFLLTLQPLFWGLFGQGGGSLNLFTDRYVARERIPASVFQSIDPIYIVLLGPLFAAFWTYLGRRNLEPPTSVKFGMALMLLGGGFLILNWGAYGFGIRNATPVIFIFLFYLFQTAGELCLSPVGISAMSRLAPPNLGSLIMGAWFFATAGGNFIAGKIGQAAGAIPGSELVQAKELVLAVYWRIGWIAVLVGTSVVLISPLIGKIMDFDATEDQ